MCVFECVRESVSQSVRTDFLPIYQMLLTRSTLDPDKSHSIEQALFLLTGDVSVDWGCGWNVECCSSQIKCRKGSKIASCED